MVLHEWAFEDESDNFIHISDAIPSKPYRCTKSGCGLEIRRRAGSMEPHFFHLNPEGGQSCEGGEGPRHKHVKLRIAELCKSLKSVKLVRIEQKVSKYIVDVFIQTDFGPFYIEVIDSHPPEEEKWESLNGRIIPFWINIHPEDDYSHYLDEYYNFTLNKYIRETLTYHFRLIALKANKFALANGLTLEEAWSRHMDEIYFDVQKVHRQARSDMPTLYSRSKDGGEMDQFVVSYNNAKRTLLRKDKS